jgi:hypothetical protein
MTSGEVFLGEPERKGRQAASNLRVSPSFGFNRKPKQTFRAGTGKLQATLSPA